MKAILFFVPSGRVTDSHKEEGTALAAATGKKVVFRNSTIAISTGEKPEPCEGVAGTIPPAYAARFPSYDAKGNATVPEGGLLAPEGRIVEMNVLGLPKGCPDDRNALKAALKDEGVEFHPNTKTETLVDLFRATVLAKKSEA
jgi:hypothetical protein